MWHSEDELPVHGFIGHVEEGKHYLFTHVQFNALYNGNQVSFGFFFKQKQFLLSSFLTSSNSRLYL